MRVLIIGSGIGGPVAATALRRAGIDATVFEAHDGPGTNLGAHLGLAPNGLAVLRSLDLLRPVLEAPGTLPSSRIEFRDGRGRIMGRLSDGSTELEPELRSVSARRGVLQTVLAETAADLGTTVEYGRRLVRHTDTGSEVIAEFADGSVERGDVLVGADGIHSVVRRSLFPDAPAPTYTGLLDLGGRTPNAGASPTPEDTSRLIWGRRAFAGYQTAPDGDAYWFVNVPHPELTREEIAARPDSEWKRFALDLAIDRTGDLDTVLRASEPRLFRPRGVYTIPTLPHWHRGRVALLGDAAHALPNSSGQGASMAMEDALVLAMCLRDSDTPERGLAAYERIRRGRVEAIIEEGTRRGDLKLVTHPVGVFLRDRLLLPLVFRRAAGAGGHSPIFDHRVDFDAPVAT